MGLKGLCRRYVILVHAGGCRWGSARKSRLRIRLCGLYGVPF